MIGQTSEQQTAVEPISNVEKDSFYTAISDVLSNHWDPLGIFDTEYPHDRYSNCVSLIYSYAIKSKTKGQLADYLGHLASSLFGSETNIYNDKRAAGLIVVIRDFYFDNNPCTASGV